MNIVRFVLVALTLFLGPLANAQRSCGNEYRTVKDYCVDTGEWVSQRDERTGLYRNVWTVTGRRCEYRTIEVPKTCPTEQGTTRERSGSIVGNDFTTTLTPPGRRDIPAEPEPDPYDEECYDAEDCAYSCYYRKIAEGDESEATAMECDAYCEYDSAVGCMY